MNRTDEQIKVDVVKQLEWNASVDASDVRVEVNDGIVILSGSVEYFSNKRAAETSAGYIPGVVGVKNNLEVKYPTFIKIPTDSEIKNNIENAILWDSDIFSFDVDVVVKNGEVEVRGVLDSYWKKIHLENVISNILGVVNVINKVAVVSTNDYEDVVIAQSITDAIDRLRIADPEQVNITVTNGVVSLTGVMPSWISKRAVENAVAYTPGVIDVKSMLKISTH